MQKHNDDAAISERARASPVMPVAR